MKKIITFIVLVVSIAGMAQGLTITTTQTPTQLINDVLISSPCFIATNVTASTGTNFSSTNGIGYFSNSNANPNFPFTSGVVLTTGNVTKVPSPNNVVLGDGTLAWPGDTDMQTALLSQGVSINSVNASLIEFDFTAATTQFNLSFVFASEEYGASQCNFSDAFAFLIRDVTAGGTYQNLATVPNPAPAGTPITVATIRDATYNPGCPSANQSFFGAYNGGGFGPAINFNGQTVPMDANAPLILNHNYHVKLVVADGNNNVNYDSAIFLQAKSLNIGGDVLGLDYISANLNATPSRNGICPGSTFPTLQPDTALPAGTIYQWKKLVGTNFINIGGATGSSLNLQTLFSTNPPFAPNSAISTYALTYTRPGCEPITDEIVVESFAAINSLSTIPPIYKCSVTGATSYNFDLTTITPIIVNNNTPANPTDDLTNVTITYHSSQADANSNVAIANPSAYNITAAQGAGAGLDVYVKIKNNTSQCSEIRTFKLIVVPPPTIANTPQNLTTCALNIIGVPRATFDLNANINLILGNPGGQDPTYNIFSFYYSQTAANNGFPAIPVPASYMFNSNSTTIFVRLQNISNPSCVEFTSFTLTVTPLALVDILPDVVVCNNFVLPVLVQTTATYWTLTGGPTGGGSQLFANNVITPGAMPTTIWVYNANGICKTNDSFKITKANLPVIAPASASYCQTAGYLLSALPYGTYYKYSGGPTASPQQTVDILVPIVTPGANNFYIWFENTGETPVCTQEKQFTITIIPFTLLPDYTDKFGCTTYTLNTPAGNGANYYNGPGGTNGIITTPFTYSTLNSQKIIYVYKQSATVPNCTSEKTFTIFIGLTGGGFIPPQNVNSCTPYTLPVLDFGEYRDAAGGGGSPIIAPFTISGIGTTTIFFYVPGQVCTGNLSFDVTIALPALAPIPDVGPFCDVYYLPEVPNHPNGNYFTGPLGTGTKYVQTTNGAGTPIITLGVQTIFFYDKALTGTCYVQDDFQLTINPSPQISNRPISVVTCNQPFVLDDLQFGEYYEFQGGPSVSNPILPSGYNIASPNPATPGYKEIWVYSGSTTAGNTCFQEYSIKIYLVNTVVTPINDITVCDTYTLPDLPLNSGDYYTATGGPLGTGTKIIGPYTPFVTTTTFYLYKEDNNRVACSDEDAFTITIVKTPDLNPVAAVTVCDSYTVPLYSNAMFTFTTTNPGTVTKFYKNPGGAAGNLLATDIYSPSDLIQITPLEVSPKVVTIYPYTEALGTGVTCFDDEPFVITINRTPVIAAAEVVNVTACDTYTLPALTVGKYYSAAAHLPTQELTGGLLTINSTTTVYVYAETGTNPNCFDPVVEDILVTIVTTPVVNAIAPVSSCDTYVIPNYNDPMFSSTNPITKFYKNAGGPANNQLPSDEYTPVTSSISNPGPNPLVVTIYAYSAVGSVPCFDDEPFVVTINKSPILASVNNVNACDSYVLPYPLAIGKYYPNAAYNPSEELDTLAERTLTALSTTVYVYAETATNPNCTDSDSFVVTIVPTPTISPIAALASCDSYIVPQYNDPMFSSSTPLTKFYKNAGGIANNPLASDEYAPGYVITTLTPLVVTIYAYTQAGSVPCFTDEPLVVTINKSPVIVASEVVPVTKCDSYLLPALTVGNYFSDGLHLNPIINLTLTATQPVYVYAETGTAPDICSDSANFLVTINNTPQFPPAEVADVFVCNSYTLPVLSIPGAKYFEGPNGTGNEIILPKTYTSNALVYAYANTGTTPDCDKSEDIVISIYNVTEAADVTICGQYILPSLLPDVNANYYNFPGGVGPIAAGTTLLNSQTVYVYGTSPNSTCTDESDFVVTINGQPLAFDASDSVCDNDSSPFDGITPYDLTKPFITNQILGSSQAPADFTITYYTNASRTVQIIDATISTLPIVYVFVTNNLSPTCPSPATVTINVIPTPNPKLDVPPICIDSETGLVTKAVIESGYNSLQYNIVWTKKSDGTVVSNSQTFSTDVPGDYILNVSSNTVTACASAPVPFTVIESAKPAVTPPISFEITGWFTNSQTITVNATPYINNGGSNFLYSLDGNTPQVSNIFTNVGPGAHEITVIDKFGCGSRSLPISVELVTSPPAFTPNGDGINDRWDIKGDISYTTLSIFDRFGRLLKQLTQNSGGWDGTINSQSLPADDYWFSVNYLDNNGAAREFKSHFSLIR